MHYDSLMTLPFLAPLGIYAIPVLGLLLIWTTVVKGFALWKAARNMHKAWFVVLLIVNTVGILELLYIFWFSRMGQTGTTTPTPVSSASEA